MLLFSRVSRIVRVPFESSILRRSSRLFEYSLDRLVKIDAKRFYSVSNAMNQQAELQARAILLEQYKRGGVEDVDVALKSVELELGPDLITHDSAAQFFQQFKNGNEDISDGASDHDSQLIRNGTFLNCKRAMCCELPRLGRCTSTPIFGKNGRYQIYSSDGSVANVLVDTFHGIRKKLQVNWKSALLDVFGKKMLRYVMFCSKTLLAIHHVDETNVLGTVTMFADREFISMMFRGKLDYENATLDIEKLVNHVYDFEQRIFIDPVTTQPSMLISTRSHWEPNTKFADIDLSNGNLAFKNEVNLPYILDCPTVRDGKVVGFLNTKRGSQFEKFVEISLADGTKEEFDVVLEKELKFDFCQRHPYLWIGDKLLVASSIDAPEIYEFDLTNRKWTKSTIEVGGWVRSMSIAGNVLIVHAYQHSHLTHQFYRFPLEGKETPEIETWLKIRRRVLFHPKIPSRPSWAGDSEEALNDDEE
ncbi:hypothetical protein M3Y94_00967100 [Aphelenchoides besseyi]|nr:hypothetical protein M3Y94_00967100 [Aphelenchoides besseyi]KAI6224660.1 hypothetical protein M3Y95_00776200 [Aphelenchoides besseyi]